ncbi:class I SAM-dependent methyltransferase [Halostagnicola bangensis]
MRRGGDVYQEEGLRAVLKKIPPTVRSFAGTVFRDIKAMFVDSEEIREIWVSKEGKYSPEYYASKGIDETSELVLDVIESAAEPDDHILEIGCSSGRHLAHLYHNGYENLSGIEINDRSVEVMGEHFPQLSSDARIHTRAVEDIVESFEDGEFDVVYSVETLEIIPPKNDWVFGEIARITDDALITVEEEPANPTGRPIQNRPVRETDGFPVFRRRWSDIFSEYGFDSNTVVEQDSVPEDTVRVFRRSDS